ncbi:MAG: hypothetical protein ACM3SV_02550 [Betaproteobacteria bacterium]
MKTFAASLALATALWASPAAAGDARVSANLESWTYVSGQARNDQSPFNPQNRVAGLPSAQWSQEIRFNLRFALEDSEFVLRPRLLQQHDIGRPGDPDHGDAYLSQGFVRHRLGPAWTLTAGRELLTWGPANFRSPSNPLYFDADKTNPLREVSGVDLVRIGVTQGPWSATLAHVVSDAHLADNHVRRPLTLAKLDWRGEESLVGVIAATPMYDAPFLGAFAQATLDEAWLVYGEFGNGRRGQALTANASAFGPPFVVEHPAPRRTTLLLGASYTLENGQSVSFEGLHDGHGFDREASRRYFARANAVAAAYRAAPDPLALRSLGQALGQSPALLGRDYLALMWQSNPQESGQFWRLTWVADLTDRSHQLTAYYEKNLARQWSAFAAINLMRGPADSEATRLLRQTLTVGVKFFVF